MTFGFDLIAATIREGGHSGIKQLKPELFLDEEQRAFNILKEFYLENGELPPFQLFQEHSIFLETNSNTSFKYNYNKVHERAKYNTIRDTLGVVENNIRKRQTDEAEDELFKCINKLVKFKSTQSSFDGWRVADEMLDEYEFTKELKENNLYPGIFSGWAPLDMLTHGYRGGDLIVFSGRKGVGKTYVLCRQVLHSIIRRYRVVYITMEMGRIPVFRRMAAIQLRLNPNEIITADLSEMNERRLRTTTENFNQYPIKIIDGAFKRKLGEVTAEINEYRPDIVYIDGSYLLEPDDVIRVHWERQAHIHQVLKSLALSMDIPIVCTVQQNRASKSIKDGDGIVAGSDVIEQLASVLVSISKINNNGMRRRLNLVKNRDGAEDVFAINFIFNRLNLDVNEEETIRQRETLHGRNNQQANQDYTNETARRMM